MKTLTVVEAKSKLSDYLSRAASGERFLIQRRGRSMAVLLGVDELSRLERSQKLLYRLAESMGQRPEIVEAVERGEIHPTMLAYGLWAEEEDLEDLASEIRSNRDAQPERIIEL